MRSEAIPVLYVADSLMAGGIESQLVALAHGLQHSEFAPHILCLYGPTVRDLHFAPELHAANLPLYLPDLRLRAWDKVRAIGTVARVAWKVRPAIIQAEGYHANLLTRLAMPLLPPRTRLIGSLRGVHSRKQMVYERLSHRLCAAMVVNAPHLKASLMREGRVPADKIVHIPNGIPTERFAAPHDPGLRASLAVPGAEVTRLFVSLGRVSFEKNLHWTAAALGTLKRDGRLPAGVRLLIAGPRQDAAAQQVLEETVGTYGLADVVIQHPATPHPEDYYYACDACVLYSPNEGLSNVGLESLAAGRPVVISQAANAAGAIQHGVTGWVVPDGSVEELAVTLHEIISMPGERLEAMRAACVHRAGQYSADAMVREYTCLYRRLAGPVAQPRP